MLNNEELKNQISTETTRVENEPLWLSEESLEYAFGHSKKTEKTRSRGKFQPTAKNMNLLYK